MPLLILIALLWFMPGLAVAQCCGDCGGDGEVSISDLITAVNNALNGCPATTPTPTPSSQCPINFQDDNSIPGTPDCYYRGRWNQSCGRDDLATLWRSDGGILIVDLRGFEPGLFFGAEVTAAGSADLFCWYTNADASDCDQHPVSGRVTLAAGGDTLTIAPQGVPFSIEDCAFARYAGALFTVDTPAAARAAAAAPRLSPQVLRTLRENAAARYAGANFQRR